MELQHFLLENLRAHKTIAGLRKSAFYADYGKQLESFLKTPQLFACPGARPRLRSFLRVAQWNIEKGKRFHEILDCLQSDDVLKWADVLILNEADYGMNRSQNRHVARDLAEALSMNMAFAPAHLELTPGTDEDRLPQGDNRESLQGNAILSRYPVLEAHTLQLPVTFEPYEFEEKRFGWRNCVWAGIELGQSLLWVGSAHLELRNTPGCRARQMLHIMENLPGSARESYILGGDLNTNGFSRGTFCRTLRSVFRLMLHSPPEMKSLLLHPERGSEPLFDVLEKHGFAWEGFNSSEETARTGIDSLEENSLLPVFLSERIRTRLEPYHGYLCFKLDWFLGKNMHALTGGQKRDIQTDIISSNPSCVKSDNAGAKRLSDHRPIYVDLDLG